MGTVIKRVVNGTRTFEPETEPYTYSIQKSDLYSDSTGRSSETGLLLSYPIRRNIYTIHLEYYGNGEEIRNIEEMIDGTSLGVTFLENGDYETKIMYPSDREKTAAIILNGKEMYSLSFSLIEY